MSRILFDAFDSGAATVALTVAADATAELSAAAQVSESIGSNVAALFGDELTAAAVVSNVAPEQSLTIAAAIGDELAASAILFSNIYFVPPAPGDPRVAVVTHSN